MSARTPRTTRRGFVKMLVAGSAAALAAPAAVLEAATTTTKSKPAVKKPVPVRAPATHVSGTGHPALPAEIEKLKGYVADSLKTLRAHPLPIGSPMAFAFKPMRPRRGRKGN